MDKVLLSDKVFCAKITEFVDKIFEDGVIDAQDIPTLITGVVYIYNNHAKVKVPKDKIGEVIGNIVTHILETNVKYQELTEDKKTIVKACVKTGISLALVNISTISPFIKRYLCCCFFKSENPTELLKEHKHVTGVIPNA